ncbi:MAG: VanW family protein [Fibrella sp.]|nr:VanW family protein [Armatimonadota bacterium]
MKRNLYLSTAAIFATLFAIPSPITAQSPAKPESKPVSDSDSAKRLAVTILLTDGVKSVKRTRKELGFALASQSPVRFSVDKARLKDALGSISKTFQAEGVNARPVIDKGAFSIKPGQSARSLNVATTAERITNAVSANPATVRFNVSLDKKPPVLTAERLKGINGRLAQFSTTASGTEARDTNIALAVEDINGTLLSPGETFSLNEVVGRRTKAKGYKEAPVFVNAKKVPGVGGGVSQVTGTLFNAAALAGLDIIQVNPHSRPVAYLPLGRDATVAYGSKDLRFKNDTDAPVYIVYAFVNDRLTATLWGKAVPGQKISLRPRVQRLGSGKINAQLYRLTKVSGKVTGKEKLLSHAYRWKPGED